MSGKRGSADLLKAAKEPLVIIIPLLLACVIAQIGGAYLFLKTANPKDLVMMGSGAMCVPFLLPRNAGSFMKWAGTIDFIIGFIAILFSFFAKGH